MDERRDAPFTLCPACQAPNGAGARFCSVCGAELLGGGPPTTTGAAMGERGAPPTAGSNTGQMRQCQWCGATSPIGADQCEQCGAMFPRPEQDEALLRAAEERLRAANDTLDMMRRRRGRRGITRFLVN